MISEKEYELIDGYLKDELSDDAHIEFEKFVKENEAFKEEFEIQKQLYIALALKKGTNTTVSPIKEAIETASKEYHQSGGKVINFDRRWMMGIAASILLLIGYFVLNPSEPNLSDLYVSNADWTELPSFTVREDSKNALNEAQVSFENKNFEEANAQFNKLLENGSNNPQILMYLGISYLELNDFENAITTFEGLQNGKSLDSNKALWYKALTYLKWNRKELAINTLNELLKDPSNYKHAEAQKIYNELN